MPSKQQQEPLTVQEAYLQEILADQITMKDTINEATAEMKIRLGTVQMEVEEHLGYTKQIFDNYAKVAEEYNERKKEDNHRFIQKKLRSEICETLNSVAQKRPRFGAAGLASVALIAACTGSLFGVGGAYLYQGKENQITMSQAYYQQKGQMLEKAWPELSNQTKQALEAALLKATR
ncbi:hypothetical protein [Dongshaea marina]|uniref:hypothetical protein n=1 Tax=Dongshaea marina TaxID=2047966 RepID=UPI000D3E671A|nr:hypothetical protein [Dongshaea marina]